MILKKLSPNFHNSLKNKRMIMNQDFTIPLKKKRTIMNQGFTIPLKKKKMIMKKPSSSLHNSIEEKENDYEEAITKPLQFY
ncbi:hypothetical protein F8M41_006593 [Gigaspora margarita]|uniref:Uncharacterized protein n=1 Tax=Gigaspora margarita TaxID=4874 RepID=A0A8H3X669_GIGMA|nr:hypothetical protein F8M41_006593 [Gigaspora margarita]